MHKPWDLPWALHTPARRAHAGDGGQRIRSWRQCLTTWRIQNQPGLPVTLCQKIIYIKKHNINNTKSPLNPQIYSFSLLLIYDFVHFCDQSWEERFIWLMVWRGAVQHRRDNMKVGIVWSYTYRSVASFAHVCWIKRQREGGDAGVQPTSTFPSSFITSKSPGCGILSPKRLKPDAN